MILNNININRGYKINYQKKIFEPIIKTWFMCIRRYCHSILPYSEGPYEYNERATLSTLAASIWMAGGIALEEYCYTKQHGKRNKRYEGRIDIYFRYNNKDFAGEAKQRFINVLNYTKPGILYTKINSLLRIMRKEVKRIPSDQGKRISIIFLIPQIQYKKKLISLINKNIRTIISKSSKFGSILSAWYFPKIMRSNTSYHKFREGDYYYPGIILIIKKLW